MNVKITLSDGKIKEFQKNISILEVAKLISSSLSKQCIYAVVDNKKMNLSEKITKDCNLILVTTKDNSSEIINNSCAKMINKLMSTKFKEFSMKSFSANEDYFFIDFDIKTEFKEKDLSILNNKLSKLVLNYQSEQNDLIINPKFYNTFRFLNISGIYIDGNKNNKMIKRITGIASFDKASLLNKEKEILKKVNSDHRTIGKKMKLFTFNSLVGQGLPIWLPNGTILKNEISKYIKEIEVKYDFLEVVTPCIGTKEMYIKSGHWDHYRDDMFAPIKMNNEEFILRPMTCPHHIAVYKTELYSYKDLPIRISEHADLFRYESSGSLTGLERVRMMNLTDSHIFVTPSQLKSEFSHCFKLIKETLKTFNIEISYFSLSTRDKNNKEKYQGNDKIWDDSEAKLKEVLDEMNVKYKIMPGEAAFYGPKLDIQINTSLNHEITVSTIQFDFLTAKSVDATYINEKGKKETPVMIHRGLIGTYERFIAILLEQTKGMLPLWITPEQVRIIPVNNKVSKYVEEIRKQFKENFIRSKIDYSEERLSYKVREAQINKVPFQLIIGDKEQKSNVIAVRKYGEESTVTIKLDKFISSLKTIIKNKK